MPGTTCGGEAGRRGRGSGEAAFSGRGAARSSRRRATGLGGFAPVHIQPRAGGGGREVMGRRGGVAEEDGGAVGVAIGGVGSAGSIPIQIGSGGGEWRRGEGG